MDHKQEGFQQESNDITKLILLCMLFVLLYVLFAHTALPTEADDQFEDAVVSHKGRYIIYYGERNFS